jgi:predicted amidohydrolase
MKLALCHFSVFHKDKDRNLNTLLDQVIEAAKSGAQMIVTPELALSGYSFGSQDAIRPLTERVPGEATNRFSDIANTYSCYICLGMAEEAGDALYNSAVVIGPDGRIVAKHRKITAEKSWAADGAFLASSVFDTPWGRVGVLVCSDSYYGILPRLMAKQGADLLLVPANWPPLVFDPREIWSARARENRMFIAVCNRTGMDLRMDCREAVSEIYSPKGKALASIQSATSKILFCDLKEKDGRLERDVAKIFSCPLTLSSSQVCQAMELESSKLQVEFFIAADDFAGNHDCLDGDEAHLPTNSISIRSPTHIASGQSDGALIAFMMQDNRRALVRPGNPVEVLDSSLLEKHMLIFSWAGARVALITKAHIEDPEIPFALSLGGVDVLLLLEEEMTQSDWDNAAIRSVERLAIAVSTPHKAVLINPPLGHNRWTEQQLSAPGKVMWEVDLSQTRDKEMLRRADCRRPTINVQHG